MQTLGKTEHGVCSFCRIAQPLGEISGIVPATVYVNFFVAMHTNPIAVTVSVYAGNGCATPLHIEKIQSFQNGFPPYIRINTEWWGQLHIRLKNV